MEDLLARDRKQAREDTLGQTSAQDDDLDPKFQVIRALEKGEDPRRILHPWLDIRQIDGETRWEGCWWWWKERGAKVAAGLL